MICVGAHSTLRREAGSILIVLAYASEALGGCVVSVPGH